ncbi:MAG: hypothetical protein AAAC48_10065, partial [Phyllobacterium sp.]|uniref:hypothetical protein n=1 Tax=Phyllobacterium sp. TaxID=1871046 RepID=UPI0030F2A301
MLATLLGRIGGFLAARIQLFAELVPFISLRDATWSELNNSRDAIALDVLPQSGVGKVCHILKTAGALRENATVLELGAASGVQTTEMATCGAFS